VLLKRRGRGRERRNWRAAQLVGRARRRWPAHFDFERGEGTGKRAAGQMG